MKRSKTETYNQVMDSACTAGWLRHDLSKLPQDKAEGLFAVDEVEWLIFMREALVSFHMFIERFGDDQDVKNLAESTVGPLVKYLEHRMQAKGMAKRYKALRERFQRDGARHSLVREIERLGYSKTDACKKAADLLYNINHPLGVTPAGNPVDTSTIEKSVTRWEECGLPEEIWRLPGSEPMPPIPDPAESIKPRE